MKEKRLLFFLICLCLVSCSSTKTPQITITSDSFTVPWLISTGDTTQVFAELLEEDPDHIAINSSVNIQFDQKLTGTIKVTDRILNKDGSDKYSPVEVRPVDISLTEDSVTFTLPVNDSVFLSSDDSDYSSVIRGFVLTHEYNNQITEYLFIIETDPF